MSGSGRESFRMSGSDRESLRMSGSGRDALPEVQKWSEDPPGCLVVVSWPSRMSGNFRESLPDARVWSRLPSGCPGVVGSPSEYPGVVMRLSQMSGRGWKSLPYVPEWWEALLDVRQLSVGPPDVREAHPAVQESSKHNPGCPGVVGRPFRMFGNGREALSDVRERSKDYLECPRVIRRHS